MSLSRTTSRFLISIAVLLPLTVVPRTALAQDSLARAKDFYAAAAYEEALSVLNRLNANPSTERSEVAAYQVFCLVALGRSDEAKKTAESLVRTDPLYRLSDKEASPRVRAFFDDVRRPLLPQIVKQTYSQAKDAYDRKDHEAAAKDFDRTIALIDEIGTSSDRALSDLRTLASGFRDLAKAARPAPPPEPPPAPTSAAVPSTGAGTPVPLAPPPAKPSGPDAEPVYGPKDTDVTRPVAIQRAMPEWRPTAVEAMMDFRGSIELLVGANGKVISAAITDSIHPVYDKQLQTAALGWTFKPALKQGKPVRYRYALDIQLKK
jgi:tetratricopeptide (TPR) repeat protein